MSERYTHGHHDSVLRSHRWRTAANSASYLLVHLERGQRLLDVGCGPGSITVDLAERVAPGLVVGIDRAADVVAEAEAIRAARGAENVELRVGDVYALAEFDDSYDVVHAHQVLQHLADPVAALTEMRRVLRPGGVLAVRDSDYHAFAWAPTDPLLDRWLEVYTQVTVGNGAECRAGRFLKTWVRAAGFTDVVATSSTWTFSDETDRGWWSDLWAERVVASGMGAQALEAGLCTEDELAHIAAAWHRWGRADDGIFIVVHGEVVARAPSSASRAEKAAVPDG